jgi:hypothetical protein
MAAPPGDAEGRAGPSCAGGAYAGIGSRDTPAGVLESIESIAGRLARRGMVLRTGASPGADQAFYRGARAAGGNVELYLPWPEFEADSRPGADLREVLVLPAASAAGHELAARFHPGWEALEEPERRLLARDGHQVLGADLQSPARFLVCWTADGSLDGRREGADGTRQALRIAHHHGIPVFNLARPDHARRMANAQLDGCVC